MNLNKQQKQILEVEPGSFKVMKIKAFAGTGKSTTLAEYAKKYSKTKFFYFSFSKSNALDAKKVFPNNVTCITVHSFAYNRQLSYLQSKPKPTSNLSIRQIHTITGIKNKKVLSYILKILKQYCISDDSEISEIHIPLDIKEKIQQFSTKSGKETERVEQEFIKAVTQVWETVISDTPTELTHDIYFKKFSLSDDFFLPCDVILLDEGQDHNPVTIDLIKKFKKPLILVGDSYQQIYSFRGSIDAMDAFDADKEFLLTGSFRFGPSIAKKANKILSLLINEKDSMQGLAEFDNSITSTCYIARTNAALIDKLIDWGDKPYKIIGNIKSLIFEFEKLLDIYNLWKGNRDKIKSEEIKEFKTFEELKEHAEETGEAVIMRSCRFVLKYQNKLPKVIDSIRNNLKGQKNIHTDTIISTCHKTKGKEFDEVVLLDDFKYPYKKGIHGWEYSSTLNDETNLLYVAITRAKKKVVIPEDLSELLNFLENKKEKEIPNKVETGSATIPHKVVRVIRNKKTDKPEKEIQETEKTMNEKRKSIIQNPISFKRFMEGSLGKGDWDIIDENLYYHQFIDPDSVQSVFQDDNVEEIEDWGQSLDDQGAEYYEHFFGGIDIDEDKLFLNYNNDYWDDLNSGDINNEYIDDIFDDNEYL